MRNFTKENWFKFGILVILLFIILGLYLFTKQKYFPQLSATQIATVSQSVKTSNISKQSIPKDWGTITSELGFSLGYPYKEIGAGWGDDEYLQVFFFFPPSIISVDASITEKLRDDINNMHLYGFILTVFQDDTVTKDFKKWLDVFLKKEDGQYGNEQKLLSKKVTTTTFVGLKGYIVTRLVEGSKNQLSPHYTQKEIFINKGKFVYQITSLTASKDTKFPRSGLVGKKYLERVDALVTEILKTFVFDGSTKTAITVPRVAAPQRSGEAKIRREKLLIALRAEPFFDPNTSYPALRDKCTEETPLLSSNDTSKLILHPSPGIYFSADNEMADLHAYDNKGGHTGLMPKLPGTDFYAFPEERVLGVGFTDLGSIGYGLSLRENIDGRIELVGKKYGTVIFGMRSDGNACGIVNIQIPVTPYSIGTLPITLEGDIGPFSYDIDGDGKQDFVLSLLHPLLPEKQTQLNAVIADMKTEL